MHTTEKRETPQEFDVSITRTFEAPLDAVWKAWADAEEVKKWWGPVGFTCPVAEVDLREGGRTLVAMRAPAEYGGGDSYNAWTFTRVVPHERIEYIFTFTDPSGNQLRPSDLGMPPGIPEEGRHVVTFRDLGGGRTEMVMVEHGYSLEQARDMSRAGLEECLDKMAAALTGTAVS